MAAVILIVDDHPVVPLALRGLIENRMEGIRALQAASLRQARSVYESEPELAVTILDVRLPDVAGLEGISNLRALRPEVPIVVFTGLNSEPLRQSAIAMGAAGIVSKNENASVLLETVERLISDKLPQDGSDSQSSRAESGELPELSPRQQQMWQAIAEGLSNIEIADRYSISLNTTKAHVRELLNRLGVRNRTEAATLYYRARTAK